LFIEYDPIERIVTAREFPVLKIAVVSSVAVSQGEVVALKFPFLKNAMVTRCSLFFFSSPLLVFQIEDKILWSRPTPITFHRLSIQNILG
jgi:hypothetical protein